jgi:tetratricopeptide (TPR) repeat protein
MLAERPHDAVVLHLRGLLSYQAGDLTTANDFMARSIALDGSDPDAWSNLGMVHAKQEKNSDALRLFGRALELNPNHLDALHNIGSVLKKTDRAKEALPYFERLVRLRPTAIPALCNLAAVQYEIGNTEGAIGTYQKVLALAPDEETARNGLGEAYESLGQFEQARLQYTAVLRRQEDNVLALVKVLQLREGTVEDRWVQQATKLAERQDLKVDARIRLNVALGHYYDRLKNYDLAFTHLQRGCDEQFRKEPFSAEGYRKAIDTIVESLDAEFFKTAPTSGNASSRPIFIVGMPRSGTTLVEQILASHSAVAAGGELAKLPQVCAQTKELSKSAEHYPRGVRTLDSNALAFMADRYLQHLNTISSDAPHITDKLPFNFMYLGLIALLFPNAAIVHCRRSPMDNCLSAYFTSFADKVQFANNLETLGSYYVDYNRLMKHWHSVLPGRIFDLQYEELVADTQNRTAALLSFCNLPWEDACMRFYETERGVRTPSRWQVRQPIYSQSVQRWKHYEKHLEPLRKQLAPLL